MSSEAGADLILAFVGMDDGPGECGVGDVGDETGLVMVVEAVLRHDSIRACCTGESHFDWHSVKAGLCGVCRADGCRLAGGG